MSRKKTLGRVWAEKKHLLLTLHSGEWFENMRSQELVSSASVPYRRETFSTKRIVLDFDSGFSLTDASDLRNNAQGKSWAQIMHDVDSMNVEADSLARANYATALRMYFHVLDTISKKDSIKAVKTAATKAINIDTLFNRLDNSRKQMAVSQAMSSVSGVTNDLEFKAMLSHLYNYAIENDICDKDYAQFIDLTKYSKKDKDNKQEIHSVFTDNEIDKLWENSETSPTAQTVLMMIYTGVRISELLNLKKSEIHISEQWFHVSKSKTTAGVRDVPIADKVLPLFQKQMETSGEYLFSNDKSKYTYSTFKKRFWDSLSDEFEM